MLDYHVARQSLEERRRAAGEARLASEIRVSGRKSRPARRALGKGLVRVGLWLLDVEVARAAAG